MEAGRRSREVPSCRKENTGLKGGGETEGGKVKRWDMGRTLHRIFVKKQQGKGRQTGGQEDRKTLGKGNGCLLSLGV